MEKKTFFWKFEKAQQVEFLFWNAWKCYKHVVLIVCFENIRKNNNLGLQCCRGNRLKTPNFPKKSHFLWADFLRNVCLTEKKIRYHWNGLVNTTSERYHMTIFKWYPKIWVCKIWQFYFFVDARFRLQYWAFSSK